MLVWPNERQAALVEIAAFRQIDPDERKRHAALLGRPF
jgi:hypothetical protein